MSAATWAFLQTKIPALEVLWYDGRRVGRVVAPGPNYFAYDPAWLETKHDLSPLRVPFADAPFLQRTDGFDQLPGFLADCLPDQWGQRIMAQKFRSMDVSATPMRKLAWVGARGIGALRFRPELNEEASSSSWNPVAPALLEREAQAVLHNEPLVAFKHLAAGGTPGGALPKATVGLLPDGSLLHGGDLAGALEKWPGARFGLLKLDGSGLTQFRGVDGRTEHAYMAMAHAAGIRTADTAILADRSAPTPRFHLFVERFDHDPATGRRFHLHTLSGILHAAPTSMDYSALLETTRQLTQDHREVVEAVRRMLFNVCAGNSDDHGKNHSFIYDEDRLAWRLSPAYDVTLSFERGVQSSGLFHHTFGETPSREVMLRLAQDVGVTEGEFSELESQVAGAIAQWPEIAAAAGLPDADRERARDVQGYLASLLAHRSPAPARVRKRLW